MNKLSKPEILVNILVKGVNINESAATNYPDYAIIRLIPIDFNKEDLPPPLSPYINNPWLFKDTSFPL